MADRIDTNYAGGSHEERKEQEKSAQRRAQEQPGGPMAEKRTEPNRDHSSGKLSEEGRKAW